MTGATPGSGGETGATVPLWIGGVPHGRLIPKVEAAVAELRELFRPVTAGGFELLAGDSADDRSRTLQAAALALRRRHLVPGWRDELCALLAGDIEIARFERGAFRTLGIRNRAVHVNGIRTDGRAWIARRSALKASSPNKLDNLAAGAIAAGETAGDCLVRELWEEAGVPADMAALARFTGEAVHSLRPLAHGVHDELVLCADLELPAGFVPRCQDGEVAEFLCMAPVEVEGALAAGEFSPEAGLVVADWLRRRHRPG